MHAQRKIRIQNFLTNEIKYDAEQFNQTQEALKINFDFSTQSYGDEDFNSLFDPLKTIIETIEEKDTPEPTTNENVAPMYHTTAGAPCSGKTYYADEFAEKNKEYWYIDPDKFLHAHPGYKETDPTTYDKWRSATMFWADFLLTLATSKKKNILHGTTATYKGMNEKYQAWQNMGYKVSIAVFFARDEDRLAASIARNKTQIQHSATDFTNKAAPVYQRIQDAYLLASHVSFFMQPKAFSQGGGERMNYATYTDGQLTVHDHAQLAYVDAQAKKHLPPPPFFCFKLSLLFPCSTNYWTLKAMVKKRQLDLQTTPPTSNPSPATDFMRRCPRPLAYCVSVSPPLLSPTKTPASEHSN
jgi:hypothetical protein